MTSVSAVLFDFGMVLSGPPDPASWEAMKKTSGLDQQSLHRAYWFPRDDYDRGTTDSKEYWQAVAKHAGIILSAESVAELTRLDVALWTELNEPMITWVKELHRAGVRTGILSNIGDAMAQGICEKFDWIAGFHHAVWSHALKMRKPEPEIYEAAAEGLGVPAQEILFIDDRRENIEAAKAFGMQGIVYTGHPEFVSEMRELGFAYLLNAKSTTPAA